MITSRHGDLHASAIAGLTFGSRAANCLTHASTLAIIRNTMEEYKAKYAIHEACREGQSACPTLSYEIRPNNPQHPESTPSSPRTPSSQTSATQTIASQYTGPCPTITLLSFKHSCKASRSMPISQTAQAGRHS